MKTLLAFLACSLILASCHGTNSSTATQDIRVEESLRFTPEHVRMERSGDDSYSATIRGELTLPADGLLFQPSPYASDIPEQMKSRTDGEIGPRGIMLQFPTPAQPLVQSSGSQDCTIAATLSHFWRYKDERIRFALSIEIKDIPKSGMVKLKEQVPFILAQSVIYSEPMPLKPEQMKAIKSDQIPMDIPFPMGKLYRIKLGIKAEEDIYSYQFFDDKGEQLSTRIHKIESDAEGKVEIECAFLFGTPSSFLTVKLQEPRPITLQLNATIKLPATQIDRAIQQSLGENSPYQSQWTGIDFNLSPDAAQYSNSLKLTWELSGFNSSPRPDPIWIDSQEERPLEHSSALNGCTTKLNQSSMNEKQHE